MLRIPFRIFGWLAWWQKLLVLALSPLLALNLTVAFVGQSVISPLSPFFLAEKWTALKTFAAHRPFCVLSGHDDLAQITAKAERDAGLPPGLMAAVVSAESNGQAHRISYAGAMGPAQLMPGTAAMLKVKDPFDPAEAIPAGARYLAQLLQAKRTVRLAVASYNAGPGNVNGAVPKNGQTEIYVARVMSKFEHR